MRLRCGWFCAGLGAAPWSWPNPSLQGQGVVQRGAGGGGAEGSQGLTGHLVAVLGRGRGINPGRRRCRGPGAACVQATSLCCSAVSESFWIRGEDGAELAQELCSPGG